jgi:hypothetical protein
VRPLAIDLFTGLHGWAEGLIDAGFHVLGVDLEDMSRKLGEPIPPEHFSLWLQDVMTLHGSQFKDADLIVGSSPCQEFSYRAMPWKRAKALGPPELGMALFHAQFRIQREASEAAGRRIPMVVENVRGAQPWVGRARANFGSYHLWGDVPALMPITASRKNGELGGGSWFAIGSPGQKVTGMNPDGRKVPSLDGGRRTDPGKGARFTSRDCGDESLKLGGSWFHGYAPGVQGPRNHGSGSKARARASAKIAKIPFTLAHWIGRTWLPIQEQAA